MERILACLSPSPSNPKILRAAAEMAGDGTELIALFVETPQFPLLSNADRRRLQENIRTAEQLGAKLRTVSGDDVAFQVAVFARLAGLREEWYTEEDTNVEVEWLPLSLAEESPTERIQRLLRDPDGPASPEAGK